MIEVTWLHACGATPRHATFTVLEGLADVIDTRRPLQHNTVKEGCTHGTTL